MNAGNQVNAGASKTAAMSVAKQVAMEAEKPVTLSILRYAAADAENQDAFIGVEFGTESDQEKCFARMNAYYDALHGSVRKGGGNP